MPEGDSIFRAAAALHRALAGRAVTRFESVFPHLTRHDHDHPIRGQTIDRVTASGKHLLMWFSGRAVLRTHLRMHGSWHLYRPGERWMRPRHEMRIIIATETVEAVAFMVPDAEFLDAGSKEQDRAYVRTVRRAGPDLWTPHVRRAGPVMGTRRNGLSRLGPDLLAPDFDPAEAARRLSERPHFEIADALLDQHVMAGIGNIWKSETLFACRLNPFTRVGDIPPDRIKKVVSTARALLRASADDTPHRGSRLKVYGRGGEPCRICGTPIASRKQGPHARSTYWCPRCQGGSNPNLKP